VPPLPSPDGSHVILTTFLILLAYVVTVWLKTRADVIRAQRGLERDRAATAAADANVTRDDAADAALPDDLDE
jgi:hypothetical protein